MDSDDAVDALDDLEEEDKRKIVSHLDEDSAEDVKMLLSYDEDEIGSSMTTNYICIRKGMTIRQAMKELVRQAGENDNISILYVVDESGRFYGAIDLKDLIIARSEDSLEKLIVRSYPYVTDHEKISACIDQIVDYAERSLPVLNSDKKLIGIITASDVVELVDNELGDDYAKLGGLTGEEDLNEGVWDSVRKRFPWLIALLFLGMLVSSVVGMFESVVAVLPNAEIQSPFPNSPEGRCFHRCTPSSCIPLHRRPVPAVFSPRSFSSVCFLIFRHHPLPHPSVCGIVRPDLYASYVRSPATHF